MFDRFVLVTEICSQVNIHGAFLRGKKDSRHVFKCPSLLFKHVCDQDLYVSVYFCVKYVPLQKTKTTKNMEIFVYPSNLV